MPEAARITRIGSSALDKAKPGFTGTETAPLVQERDIQETSCVQPAKSVRFFVNERIKARCDFYFHDFACSSVSWRRFCKELVRVMLDKQARKSIETSNEQSSRQ